MGKQNKQAKKSIVFACVQVLAAQSRHSRDLASKERVSLAFSARCVNDPAGDADYRRMFVYTFCLINICLSLSDDANKIKTLNIERA